MTQGARDSQQSGWSRGRPGPHDQHHIIKSESTYEKQFYMFVRPYGFVCEDDGPLHTHEFNDTKKYTPFRRIEFKAS